MIKYQYEILIKYHFSSWIDSHDIIFNIGMIGLILESILLIVNAIAILN